MKKSIKNIFTFSFVFIAGYLSAQNFLSGKLIDENGKEKEILYDRTQSTIAENTFQTIYEITDKTKHSLYTVSLTHNRSKSIILVSIKETKGVAYKIPVSYNQNNCGLIFNNSNSLDTVIHPEAACNYLFSFADTARDFPVLHKIKTTDRSQLQLDPLTKLRMRRHIETVKAVLVSKQKNEEILFNQHLVKLHDSLYAKHEDLNNAVSIMRTNIENDIHTYFKTKVLETAQRKYEGGKRFGKEHGKGVLFTNGNIYDGNFVEAKFISGNVAFKNEEYEYLGEFSNDSASGTGWLKYPDGSYLLGIFKSGQLHQGITLQKDNASEVYFGGFNENGRNGYGELQTKAGGKYVGEFLNDRLVKGYSKEVDPFGYAIYSRIDEGNKTSVDSKVVEEFFGLILSSTK